MNYRFSALITKEDDWYVARCPELSVTSQGKDVESARANLAEAIELYLETSGVPEEPSTEPPSFWTTAEASHCYAQTAERTRRARHSTLSTRPIPPAPT